MPTFSSLLLDRDGTLIKDKHYLADPDGVELLPGVGESLASLARQGLRFFLVSNQSGVGRKIFSYKSVLACNERLAVLLAAYGVRFADMLFCPHAPADGCFCRKPAAGMWKILERRYGLNAEDCCMIGDKEEDMRFAAHAALAGRILVLTGKGLSVAARLGIPSSSVSEVSKFVPESPGHPQLIISDFTLLERGLILLRQEDEA
ncbi:MAG: HAD-IIIA family hydrolase [Desulfovibrio sp.]|nr:HAD-IIIA family hydrolase [Desulfovibrio sp.]